MGAAISLLSGRRLQLRRVLGSFPLRFVPNLLSWGQVGTCSGGTPDVAAPPHAFAVGTE